MKKWTLIIVFSFLIFSCDKSESPTPPVEVNVLPSLPELLFPTNGLLCIDNALEFKWSAAVDEDGDGIIYEIEIAKDNQFSEIAHTASNTTTSQTFTLEKGLAYYWRVRATDGKNGFTVYTPTFNFYTEGEAISNHLPFAPELVSPIMDNEQTAGTAMLAWTGSDIDDDPLLYDVYFGKENPPTTLISENQPGETIEATTSVNTNYYWKVVVKDDQAGQAVGQVWSFSTN